MTALLAKLEALSGSDEALETAIDSVGRSRVFALAEVNGWSIANPPPKCIWWQFITCLRAREEG